MGSAEYNAPYASRIALDTKCTVINVNYRLCPEVKFPFPIYDAYAALKDIIARADELEINVSQICLTGNSGGATIALGVA